MRRADDGAHTAARSPGRHGFLLDVNVLIALARPQHVRHDLAHQWFEDEGRASWAICPFTQLAFIRISSNPGIIPDAVTPAEARRELAAMVGLPYHRFYPETLAPTEADSWRRLSVLGHRQVGGAYLLAVAQHHGVRLATPDRRDAMLCADSTTRSGLVDVIADGCEDRRSDPMPTAVGHHRR